VEGLSPSPLSPNTVNFHITNTSDAVLEIVNYPGEII